MLPLEKTRIGHGYFVSGTVADANELTLLWDFQDICEREMLELPRGGFKSQS